MKTIIDWFRQPEYIGENRCTPCTAINIAIATGVSILAAISSIVLGVGVFVFSLVTIYLRGYLVPGTPTLTKRYFPERILELFDKGKMASEINENPEADTEKILLEAGAIEPCQEGTDLCITTDFQQGWRERIQDIEAHDVGEDHLIRILNSSTTHEQITIERQDTSYIAYINDSILNRWSSQAAAVADIAAANEFRKRAPNWSDFDPTVIIRVLTSLRIFIEQCPDCGGPVQIEQKDVESCCRSYNIAVATCQDCGTHLFEKEWNETDPNEVQSQSNQPRSTQASA